MRDDDEMPDKSTRQGEGEDLSAEIAKTVLKKPWEQVTCRRISNDHYRCNWWALQDTAGYDNPQMKGLMVTTGRISQSQFLHVTKGSAGLQIRVITVPRAK